MDFSEALDRIDSIHAHLARGELYRGFRPLALAASGLVGLVATLTQPWLVVDGDGFGFVRYWIGVALVSAAVGGSAALHGYLFREDDLGRRRARIALRQFVPCLLAGVIVTVAFLRAGWAQSATALLPPIWSLLFALGTVSSLPYLPRQAALVAVWYFLASVLLFSFQEFPTGWSVGVPFGIGQLLAAAVMSLSQRREVST